MAQFGVGPELAAQCPRVPTPEGWRAWLPESDGPIPDALMKRAQALVDDSALPLGTTESYPLPGVVTMMRLEPHAWGKDAAGNLVQGCFRATGIYLPSGTPPVASSSGWERAVTVLTVGSLIVGIGATLWGWGRS